MDEIKGLIALTFVDKINKHFDYLESKRSLKLILECNFRLLP